MPMTLSEAAGMLGIRPSGLDRVLASGDLPFNEIDGEKQVEMWDVLSLKRRGGFELLTDDPN